MRALAFVIVVVSAALTVAATVFAWLSLGTPTLAGLSLGTKAVEVPDVVRETVHPASASLWLRQVAR